MGPVSTPEKSPWWPLRASPSWRSLRQPPSGSSREYFAELILPARRSRVAATPDTARGTSNVRRLESPRHAPTSHTSTAPQGGWLLAIDSDLSGCRALDRGQRARLSPLRSHRLQSQSPYRSGITSRRVKLPSSSLSSRECGRNRPHSCAPEPPSPGNPLPFRFATPSTVTALHQRELNARDVPEPRSMCAGSRLLFRRDANTVKCCVGDSAKMYIAEITSEKSASPSASTGP